MGFQAQLLSFLLLWISDTRAETTLTQTPAFVSVAPGDKVTITCKASQDIDDDIHWYQQKPGASPKFIIKYTTTLVSGVPSRFSGSGYGTDFALTINNVESEDAAYYFCQQDDNLPFTVIYPVTKTSTPSQWVCLSCF
uniref:Immunoglobulin kappa variable 5-2 n=1 Tax=Microcebus murinus TaxID=30608 RepID=A0A8C5WAA9_MICMU